MASISFVQQEEDSFVKGCGESLVYWKRFDMVIVYRRKENYGNLKELLSSLKQPVTGL